MRSQSTARADGNRMIQNSAYRYDEVGNLRGRGRSDSASGVPSYELFGYDTLNRLTSARVITDSAQQPSDVTDSFLYDDLGNLTDKGPSHYTYGTAGGCPAGVGPHAVCTVNAGSHFVYDGNGNVRGYGARAIDYDSRNKPVRMSDDAQGAAGTTVEFVYSADGNRFLRSQARPLPTTLIHLARSTSAWAQRERVATNGRLTTGQRSMSSSSMLAMLTAAVTFALRAATAGRDPRRAPRSRSTTTSTTWGP